MNALLLCASGGVLLGNPTLNRPGDLPAQICKPLTNVTFEIAVGSLVTRHPPPRSHLRDEAPPERFLERILHASKFLGSHHVIVDCQERANFICKFVKDVMGSFEIGLQEVPMRRHCFQVAPQTHVL